MKKLYILGILFVVILIACDFGSDSQGNNDTDTLIVTSSEDDSSQILFGAIWTDGDTSFYLDSPVYNRTIDDTLIHFIRKDKENNVWVHFPYPGGQGLPVYNLTNSSFETNWLGGSMVTLHYVLESFDVMESNHITISYPGYEKTFSLLVE